MDAPVVSQTVATMFQGCAQTPKKFAIRASHLFGSVYYVRVAIGPHLDADQEGLQLAAPGLASHLYVVGEALYEVELVGDGLMHSYLLFRRQLILRNAASLSALQPRLPEPPVYGAYHGPRELHVIYRAAPQPAHVVAQ